MNHLKIAPLLLAAALVAGCGEGESAGPIDVEVTTDVDLGLSPGDRIVPGMSVGVWQASVEGDRVVISESHLLGDEAGAGYQLALDLGGSQPEVVEVIRTRFGDTTRPDERLDPGTLALQDADMFGVMSGEYQSGAGRSFTFWVDLASDTYAGDPDLNEEFDLRPGGVVDMFSFALQYVELVEDSRCPPDVQCVWEGQVIVKMRYVDEEGAEEFELRGLLTPDGPIYGDQPTWRLPGSSSSTMFSLVGLDEDTITLTRLSTEQ